MEPRSDTSTVLVVEDDAAIRALYTAILRSRGIPVAAVAEGRQALPAARKHRPAVVLLDVGLPDVCGIEVLRELKGEADVAAIPVLLVTAWDDAALVALAIEEGAAGYMRKPFEPRELVARLEALGERARAFRAS